MKMRLGFHVQSFQGNPVENFTLEMGAFCERLLPEGMVAGCECFNMGLPIETYTGKGLKSRRILSNEQAVHSYTAIHYHTYSSTKYIIFFSPLLQKGG